MSPTNPREDGRGETQPPRALSPGTHITHYRILEKIGAGGMGLVYKALDTRLDREVAIKLLAPHLLCDPEAERRFIREAKAASALSHANISTIHEIDEDGGRCFIVMEYVDGETLSRLLEERRLSIEEVLDFAIQIGKGLDAAHRKGVIHRDIKPTNVMVTADRAVKIMDFGLAKLGGGSMLTRPGTTLGTLPYMSPEQVQGKDLDQRSDVFSLGVVLYEMIAGRRPFAGDHDQAIIHSILNEVPDPVARYRAQVPEGLQRVVDKALAKDRSERYQHADEMVADLIHEQRLSGSRSPTASHVAPARPRKRLLRLLIPAAVALLLLILVVTLEPFRIEFGSQREAIAEENSLAVMYFENLPDPADTEKTAQMITALLITDLSESEYMHVISRQRLYDVLSLLGRGDSKVIDRAVASEVATRAGAKWILTGNVLRLEPGIVLTSEVSEAATGRVASTQRVSGEAGEDIFAVVDRLSAAVKTDLRLPGGARREADRPVAEVTTHSPEAYRHYLEGRDYNWKFYDTEAAEHYEKAIAHDSTFAMAYLRLAIIKTGGERRRLIDKAVEYAARAGVRERLFIEAWDAFVSREYADAVASLDKVIRKYPYDKEAFYHAGVLSSSGLGEHRRAIHYYARAIAIDPLYKLVYNALAYAYLSAGDADSSLWAINKYIELAPDEANPHDTRGDLYARDGRLDDAIASYERAVAIKPDLTMSLAKLGNMHLARREYAKAERYYRQVASGPDRRERSRGRLCLALVPVYQGWFGKALATLDEGLAADRLEQSSGYYTAGKRMLKAALYWERLEADSAVAEARRASTIFYEDVRTLANDLNAYVIWKLAASGRMEEAVNTAEAMRRELGPERRAGWDSYWLAQGMIENVRGHPEKAAGLLERIVKDDPDPEFHIRCVLAETYLALGRLGDAVRELEEAQSVYDFARIGSPLLAPKLHYLLGQAYERSGWRDKASEQYEEFLRFWGDGDPGIPAVEDARERLARLASGA